MASRDLVDVEYLSQFFHLPITEASKELGICATALKKICRKHGIPRWPARKIRSIDKIIAALQDSLEQSPHDENVFNELDRLKRRRTELIQNPSLAAAPDERRISKLSGSRRRKTKGDVDEASESPDTSVSPPASKPVASGISPNGAINGFHQPNTNGELSPVRVMTLTAGSTPVSPYVPYGAYPIMYPPAPYTFMTQAMFAPTMMAPMYSSIPSGPVSTDPSMHHGDVTPYMFLEHQHAMAALSNPPGGYMNSLEAFAHNFPFSQPQGAVLSSHVPIPNESLYRYMTTSHHANGTYGTYLSELAPSHTGDGSNSGNNTSLTSIGINHTNESYISTTNNNSNGGFTANGICSSTSEHNNQHDNTNVNEFLA